MRIARAIAAVLVLAVFGVACGDDDDDSGSQATAPVETTTPQAVVGGEGVVLLTSESGSLDPVRFTASGGSDGQYAFALYGALLQYDLTNDEMIPLLAESFTPSTDFKTWTLTLRPGLKFSDGTVFDAAAVKVNWDRLKVPENRSPGLGVAAAIAATRVVDARTLAVDLAAANATFPYGMIRTGLNYIASPTAIQSGQDLNTKPAGAGPFIFKEWVRDDHLTLTRNPNWYDSPRPYLDTLTFRILQDETSRVNTFTVGDGDAFYTSVPSSAEEATSARDGAEYAYVTVPTSRSLVFNTAKAPFNDPRVRKAVVQGIDLKAMMDVAIPGQDPATSFTPDFAPWYTPDAELPTYDKAAAQALVDQVTAQTGTPVQFNLTVVAGNTSLVALAKFVQTSLNQLKGVEVQLQELDNPSLITRVLQRDFQMTTWGFPTLEPDSGIYTAVHTGSAGNISSYSNAQVDQALDTARATGDADARADLHGEMYDQLAVDLPWFPYTHPSNGFVVGEDFAGGAVVWDGILRTDLLGRKA